MVELLLESTPDSMIIFESSGRIVFTNRHAGELFGRGHDELTGTATESLIPGLVSTVESQHSDMDREFDAIGPNDERIPIHVKTSPMHSEVIDCTICVIRDITERKQLENRLKILASFPEINPNPILELDPSGDVVFCNRAAEELFPDLRSLGKRHEFLGAIDSTISILANMGDQSISRDVRVNDQWFHQTIHRVDASIRVYGFNITDRKRVEYARELLSTAITKSKDWIYITDVNGTIEYVNDSVCEGCGYKRNELIGKSPKVWKSGFHENSFYTDLWSKIVSGAPFVGLFINRKKDGTRFTLDQTITPITDSNGVVTHFASTAKDITQEAELEERIDYLSHYDVLTGLPNRALFLDRLSQALLNAERNEVVIAVLVVDLDRFKYINDVQGSAFGDTILKEIANGLSEVVYERDTVCRFGNDEFGVAAEVARVEDVVPLVEKIRDRVSESILVGTDSVSPTANIGISVFPDDGSVAEELITNADLALAQAKIEGRNGYHFFTSRLNEQIAEFVSMESNLAEALSRSEFILYFQPYFDCGSRRITGMEALIRWMRSDGQLVNPGAFIPVLEDTRLIVPVGEWTISEACRQIKTWSKAGLPVVPISVNLSPIQFSHSNLLERIQSIVSEYKVDVSLLVFEITESTFMKDVDYTRGLLTELKNLGFCISIDDFGTGHSSLSYLKRFPIDNLKIDQSFVTNLTEDSDDSILVETIVTMAHNLKLRVIAEGVETDAHWDQLIEFDCDMAQGFCCGRPMPANEAEKFL